MGAIFPRFRREETGRERARAPTHICSAIGQCGSQNSPDPPHVLIAIHNASSLGDTAQPRHLPPSQAKRVKRNKLCQC